MIEALLIAAAFVRPLERVTTMDPVKSQSVYDSRAIQLVYETPLAIDYLARPYKLVPGFAELPRISKDGLVYWFQLRPESPVSAADMVKALERLRDKSEISAHSWIMSDVDTVKALGERCVEIRLKKKVSYFPWLMALTPTAAVLPDGSGTGPYRLKSWRKNHEMVFERKNPSKGFDTIKYLVVDDMSTQWLMFLKGEVDFIGEISRDNWDFIIGPDGRIDPELEKKGVELHAMSTLEVAYVGLNQRDPVLKNKYLRQALNCAFDFPAWEKFFNHRVTRGDGPVPDGVDGKLREPFLYTFDLEKAKALMIKAGYPEGIDPTTGRRLVLRLAIGRATQESREAGELMASFYEKIGIKLELEFMTWSAFIKAVNEGRTQLFRMAWVGDYPHVQNFLQLFYGKNVSPGVNHANYVSAVYDRAYEAEDYLECQRILHEDCPWIFTNFQMSHSLVSPRVGNYHPTDFPYGMEQFYEVR